MGVGHYHTDVSLLKFCKAKNNTGEKKKKRPRGAGGKCRAPFFRCCRPVRSLDLKMRAPSHPYERGTESNGRVTRRKAIKKEREKTKKKEKRVWVPEIWTIVVTPGCFIKSTKRVLAIVNHFFQSSALVYNI